MNHSDFLHKFKSTITLPDFLDAVNSMDEVGLSIVDPTKKDLPLVYINQGFINMTGYDSKDVIGENCRFLQGVDTDQRKVNKIRDAIKQKRSASVILKNYRKNGSTFWNQFIISPAYNQCGELAYFIGLQFDVTEDIKEKEHTEKKIEKLAHFDKLTGLMNLDYFKRNIQQVIDRHEGGTILRINLKRFRNVNNSYGEAQSDGILLEVSQRLRQVCPTTPMCRSFADDFIILFPEKHPLLVEDIIELLKQKLIKPYVLQGEEIHLDYRIGISKFPEHADDVESLLTFASLAMNEAAKEITAKPYVYFNSKLSERLEERMSIEKRFPHALENNEFILHYQPKYTTEGKVVGMEALVRWLDPIVGVINPAQFISVAEETGFIVELGTWVMYEACRQNQAWQNQDLLPIPVSVNVSAIQFVHPNFVNSVEDILLKTGLDPRFLELEITESLLIDVDHIISKLQKLKALGVSISIDDFGTGYSSINYLKDFPVDTLKIDRTFVMNVPENERDAALLNSIMQLGRSLGLTILIEGVETKEQLQFFKEHGGDLIQGYYFSKPLTKFKMSQLLLTK
ncbi:hypothetical protein GCM10011351_11800 [Paraliobacillus quinghaiensis]|uniref:Diguanylate cyclase n=1 Tax=Paraliobacillus quinghaiensis TaxID=470815 RepID=A0A917WSG1_9BACI|nr:EAL domain-containing protein [Paraliobacillus quinghaiensis]GGM27606.1 hypothetical protein GCM10011351_11800 [Paraliobacillus quinghaiensis]